MKKTITLCALLLGMSTAHSQYFRNTYGTPTNQRTTNGVSSAALGTYTSVGQGDPSVSPNLEVRVLNTDLLGTLNFANSYILLDPGSGATLDAIPLDVEAHNSRYYVSGLVFNGGRQQVFLLILDLSGAVIDLKQYVVRVGDGVRYVNVTASSNSTDLFITGTIDATSSLGLQATTFAIRVDVLGNIIWENIYAATSLGAGTTYDSYSLDAINTNYNNQGVNGELVLVGTANHPLFADPVAYLQFIDPNTGGSLPTNNTIIDLGGQVDIKSITANTSISGYTFVGNYSTTPGSQLDGMVVTTDGMGNFIWAVTYDQTLTPGETNVANDIIERYNSFGVNEFYIAGRRESGSSGAALGQIIKMDNRGNIAVNGEFTPVPFGLGTSANYAAIANSPILDGFLAFGTDYTGVRYMQMDKAYYNGVINPPTTCDFLRQSLPSNIITGVPFNDNNIQSKYFVTSRLIANLAGFGLINSCFTTGNTSGSNAKRGPLTDGANGIEVKLSSTQLEMKVLSEEVLAATSAPQPVEVSIMDMTGKLILKRTVTVTQSNSSVSIDFDGLVLPDGIYAVTCQIGNQTFNQKVAFVR